MTVYPGLELPSKQVTPTRLQLFRFSAITWNPHRIHFDREYALEEGYPDLLVHSHLHGALLAQLCVDWSGMSGTLETLDYRLRRPSTAGDELSVEGTVEAVKDDLCDVSVATRRSDGEVCAQGAATVRVGSASAATRSSA